MIDNGGFANEMIGKETTFVFLVALHHPLAVKHHEKHFFAREQDDAPWVTFTRGKGFVGLKLWEVPDVPDRYRRQDVTSEVIGHTLIHRPNPIVFPRLGSEYDDTLPAKGTIAELATPIKLENEESIRGALSDAFDRCLEELNAFLGSYILVTKDPRIKPINRQNCRPFLPMLFQRENGEYINYSLFGAREDLVQYSNLNEFSEDETWNLAVSLSRRKRNDPFSVFADRARAAHRYYKVDGDYSSAVVTAQTACEVYLNSILLAIEWEKGTPRAVTRPWFKERTSFLSRVTTYLQPTLGGNWSNPPGFGVSSSLSKLAQMRNEIVHSGKTPSEFDAKRAIEAMGEIEMFMKHRLAAKKRVYPRTTLMVLGEPGLRRLGSWDKWIEKGIEDHAAQESDWIVDFVSWRDAS